MKQNLQILIKLL